MPETEKGGCAMFILFEGIDGGGKTTLAKMLASELKAKYVVNPPSIFRIGELRSFMDEEASLRVRFLYYLMGNVFVSDQIKSIRDSHIIICDRYIDSTLAIHKILGLEIKDEFLGSFLIEKPDISFFLFTSNEPERKERIENRGKKTKYDTIKEDSFFRQKYIDYFQEKGGYIFIDTSNEEPEQSLNRIMQEISL
ncbi:MAG: hypothetical protein PHI88_00580 [Candidatus Pacebacteria bacterium]|nr:hypothetical protein [Candidatus Paceibacterota bacterium]